jgi:hypothetical protein
VGVAHPFNLRGGMHRESARSVEPELVAGALEKLQERIAVSGGAVAEAGPFCERTGAPGELAARDQQLRELFVAWFDRRE